MHDLFSFLQQAIHTLGIVVVGCGAVGSELAHRLAEHDVSRVLLVDPDNLEERNLFTSGFLSQAFAHRADPNPAPLKVRLLQAEAARVRALPWNSIGAEIADTGFATLAGYDVLCCCTDSALSRVETALAARLLNLPMLDCGVFAEGVSRGRVAWLATGQDAACYLCGMAENRRAQMLAFAASASLGCAPLPQEIPMTGIASAVQHTAREAIKLLQAFQSGRAPSRSTAWQLSKDPTSGVWSSNTVSLPHSALCPWHDPSSHPMVSLPWDEPLVTSIQRHFPGKAHPVLQLQWPICTKAVCTNCGSLVRPMHRVAWVRRRLHCIHCHHLGTLGPLACVSSVTPGDALAGFTPRQLNLPEHHLYHLRRAITFAAEGKEPA